MDYTRETIRKLNARIGEANASNIAGPSSTLPKLDEEALVNRWKHRHA